MGAVSKEPTRFTVEANASGAARYALGDRADFADVERGLIARFDEIKNERGETVLDASTFSFIRQGEDAPAGVDASLWRQSQLVIQLGLYKVVDHLFQVRGNGANLTIVDAPEGLVVIDCMEGVEMAAQAMRLFREHVNDKPVVAVIYTHTHFDHYGGVKAVVDEADVESGEVALVGPGTVESFNKYALGENVIVGNAMSRRASYTFEALIPHGVSGAVTQGIGPGGGSHFTTTYIAPNDSITATGETRTFGGWEFEFLYAPDTEAPEEMHIWIPAINAVTCAENANHTMHNIQTLRGARTRDARNFARYLDETLVRWGDRVEVHFGPHTWPVWGNANVVAFLESQRDLYKYMHDQTLRLANQGYHPIEIAEMVQLPDAIGKKWFNRYYHGSLHHNVRAVFAKELGTWDGDPASIWPLPPAENARRYVSLLGRDAILAEGTRAISEGDYRWAVQILHHLVFADPADAQAKELQADAYEQLGYQQEAPQWRGIFLTAAQELREGAATEGGLNTASSETILAMPMDQLFDFAAIHVVGERAADVDLRIGIVVNDTDERWTAWVRDGVMNARPQESQNVQATITGPKQAVVAVLLDPSRAGDLVSSGVLTIDGDESVLASYGSVLEDFDPHFNLVTP
ncbi:alkyl/aryl-sulfatase [Mumia qirimensis]|uniref:alkyl/aryl-sulfatase n=1 Tax=Mumia qirimensis TaxID=3234852 RepID=UPI00351D47DD